MLGDSNDADPFEVQKGIQQLNIIDAPDNQNLFTNSLQTS
jgi:hypothetical protein